MNIESKPGGSGAGAVLQQQLACLSFMSEVFLSGVWRRFCSDFGHPSNLPTKANLSVLHFNKNWVLWPKGATPSPTISDGVWLELLIGAGLAHSQRRRVSDPAVRDGRATILQQVKVVGHGRRVAHDPRVHSEPVLVPWPRQLGTKETVYLCMF